MEKHQRKSMTEASSPYQVAMEMQSLREQQRGSLSRPKLFPLEHFLFLNPFEYRFHLFIIAMVIVRF
jgi:hypothetical protein